MKLKGLVFMCIMLLIFSGCGNKQHHSADVNQLAEERIILDSLNKLDSIVNLLKISNIPKAVRIASQCRALAQKANTPEAIAQGFLISGVASSSGEPDSSFFYFSRSKEIATQYRINQILPTLFYNIGMLYSVSSDFKTAITYLDSSVSSARRVNNPIWLSNSYNSIGNLKLDLGDSAGAHSAIDSAWFIAEKAGLNKQMSVAKASLAKFSTDPGNAIQLLKSAATLLAETDGNEEEIASISVNIGTLFLNPDSALGYYRSALATLGTSPAGVVQLAAYNNMVYSFLEKGGVEEAYNCISLQALPFAQRLNIADWLSTIYDTYSDVMVAKGDFKRAFQYERESLKSRVEADKIKAADQVRLLAMQLDLKNKETSIRQGEEAIRQKDLVIARIFLWGGTAFSLFMLVIFIVIWQQQRSRLRLQTSMLTSAKKLLEAEEQIKGTVSMELHDMVGPMYTTMLNQLEKAGFNDAEVKKDIRKKILLLTNSLRELSHRMNNRFIGQMSFREMVEGLCEDHNRVSQIPVTFSFQCDGLKFTDEEAIHLYRILQEILLNTRKHVGSGELDITISAESGKLFIISRDNGPGFPFNQSYNGIGISNIFERARILNGRAVLDTSPGHGTKWILSVPLVNENLKTRN